MLESGFATNAPLVGEAGSVLELAGNGTLSGLGSLFTGFATVQTDGDWSLIGNGFAARTTLDGAGTLTVQGTLDNTGRSRPRVPWRWPARCSTTA